ncbi:hypothetical protein A2W14_04505 [Candidatus Gottesmanbacteria bacterium RBG_16_37_8]|uniref:Nucleoside triphosphate pyrophosphatase n=1 Tax=Candidatus Gottesmanbacteria bacterium RBG_16_37_8 TaxID=1798371 RepID=A0A1F5YSP9_9BACT|nr:MAG: hypothetical protein A2W14_04505 [Candidatus Gottesmanbacteria bacterium RBG_16_37_8]
MIKVILASASLGRKKMLSYLNVPFNIISSTVEEEKIIGKDPLDTLTLRARLKAENVSDRLARAALTKGSVTSYLILSADSGAILDRQLIGKPKDRSDAVKILTQLSGCTHLFATAVYIIKIDINKSISKEVIQEGFAESLVTFRKLSRQDISSYLSLTDYTRYAGSYALVSAQDFITNIKGSTSNVIGLPLEIIIPIFKKYNFFKPKSTKSQ